MLIKALNDYYEILSAAGNVCPEGFSKQKISHMIMLRIDGTISDIIDIRIKTKPDKKRKEKLIPIEIVLPARTQKPGIDFNIIEHRPLYIFGLNYNKGELSSEDKTNKAKKSHDCFTKENLNFTDGMTSEIVIAYRNFINNWNPDDETQNEHLLKLGKDYASAYFCFALDGHPEIVLHDMEGELMQKFASQTKNIDIVEKEICSVSGEVGSVARIHDKIKGVRGGQAAGGLLVCFNSSAEESYGKSQSFNSGISEKVMKHYTEALNTLLNDSRHRIYIDDLTIVFWAMSEDDTKELDLFTAVLGGDNDKLDSADTDNVLFNTITDISMGRKADLSSFDIDENVMFYIAGLTPNNSRISQKFIYSNKFGKIFKNTAQHQADMLIDGAKSQIPIWLMFKELKTPTSTSEKVPPPIMAGVMNAILNGTKYPESLMETAIRRVKTDKKVNYIRAGIIKACINRKQRQNKNAEVISMALDKDNFNQSYLCGRLFAVLERVQKNASSVELNRTIKNAYFSSACAKPSSVFPKLLILAQHHLEKDKYAISDNILIEEIISKLGGEFPQTLSLNEQGKFVIGYYHQYQSFFNKSRELDENSSNESTKQ